MYRPRDDWIMNAANDMVVSQPARIFRPGLLDRIKTNNGIQSDEALARLMGISRGTLQRYKGGEEPSLRAIANLADAFGLALGEIVVKPEPAEPSDQREAVGA